MGTNEPTGRDMVPGFAAMITTAREARDWSRRELADRAGLSFNTVYSIESEKRAPSLRVASALVQALGLRVWLDDPARIVPVELPAQKPPTSAVDPSQVAADHVAGPAKKARGQRK